MLVQTVDIPAFLALLSICVCFQMEVMQSFMPTTISTYDDNYKQKNNEDNDDKNNFFACTGFTVS